MKPNIRRIIRPILAILCVVSVLVTSYALRRPAVTAESPTYCGFEEHIHNEACYERRLICPYAEEEWGV